MRKTVLAAAAIAAFLSIGAPANNATAMTVASPSALGVTDLAPVQQVRWGWRHHRYWGWHHHRYWGWRHHRYWAWHRYHHWGWRHYYWAGPYYYPRPWIGAYWGPAWGPCCWWGWHRW